MNKILCLTIFILTFSHLGVTQNTEVNFIEKLLLADTTQVVQLVMENPEKYRLQVSYSKFIRPKDSAAYLRHYHYRSDINEYFYPASLAKLPVVLLAMEKLTRVTENDNPEKLYIEVVHKTHTIILSVDEILKKIFVVSENQPYDMLYDLVGIEELNGRLKTLGYAKTTINQKFTISDTSMNRKTATILVKDNKNALIWQNTSSISSGDFKNVAQENRVGEAFFEKGIIKRGPKIFSVTNYVDMLEVHQMLINIFYPDHIPAEQRFNIHPKLINSVKKYMQMLPSESKVKAWSNDTIFYDSFRKYLIVGTKRTPIKKHFRIYNKVGQANGFLSDCAYIHNQKNWVELFITATIYVNRNEVIGDGKYQYETVGLPFLAQLGKILYHDAKGVTLE